MDTQGRHLGWGRLATWIAAGVLWAALGASPAHAEEPPGTGAPVPVPDVRGLDETRAREALARAGLALGGIERVEVERLAREFGRRYTPGTVVQQAPPPSTAALPSRLPRGGAVWLRVAAGTPAPAPMPRTAPVPTPTPGSRPAPPAAPVPGPAPRPPSGSDRWPGTAGRPPPPPAPPGMGGVTVPAPGPTTVPMPVQPTPTTPLVVGPGPSDRARAAGPLEVPSAEPDPAYSTLPRIRTQVTLPCESLRDTWSLTGSGGYAFTAGSDSGDGGFYGGFDVLRTWSGCFGLGLYYRFSQQSFDRVLTGGILEDGGGFHHIGLKVHYQSTFQPAGRLYWWAGLGFGMFSSTGYQRNQDSLEGFAQVGLGYLLTRRLRLRLGLDTHAMETRVGRRDPNRDGSSRLLWWFAPQLGLEYDL